MDKITLPKSTKKIYYQIFRGVNIVDIIIFSLFLGLSALIVLIMPLLFIPKIVLGIIVLFFGLILIQKDKNDLRIYEWIFRALKYIAVGFWKPAIIVMPNFQLIENDEVLKLKHLNENLFLSGIKIQSTNLQLLNEQQQLTLITEFANLLRTITLPCKIIKTNVNYSFDNQTSWLKGKSEKKLSEVAKELLDLQIEQLEAIETTTLLTTPAVYIVWTAKSEQQVISQLKSVTNALAFSNLLIEKLNNNTLQKMWKDFNFNNNSIKPIATKFKIKNKLDSGFIWTINNLPKQINYFWLSNLFSLSNVNICVNLNPISKIKAQKQLDNAFNKIQTNADAYAQTTSQKQVAEQYKEAFLNQQQAIIDDIDVLKDISIFIIALGNKKEIANVKRELNDLAVINGWKYDNLHYLQQQALFASYCWFNLISKETSIEMTCDTFATSFPIPDTPLNDKKGFLLAETISGKPVLWDLFQKSSERPNKNMLILGESGSGKSFTTKKILTNLIYRNSKIFILDPEREYQNLTKKLNGEWIDASGSKGNIINPLEIYKLNEEDDNADTFNNQLSLLETFFILLFPKLTENDEVLTLLIELIKETYFNQKILPSSDFNNLKSTDFPTFNDLYKLICKKIKEEKNKEKILKFDSLKSKLTSLTQGAYAKYWNGHTKFKWKATNFTCFDLQGLTNGENQKIVNVQMLLILRLLGQEMVATKARSEKHKENKKLVIVVDEAHLLANENNPIALDFLFHTMKRIRKYGGSLIIITQNINDFTGTENIKKKFTGIINNCTYWLVGGMQPEDLNQLDNMYKQNGGLSEAVKTYISNANKGKFWFKVSKQQQLPIQVLQLDAEIDLIGHTE
ncbi:Mbov_0397 family ICE element conjugal transfer ATPase [Spiroplasma sp. AdecLV25b]|uniref:Mbov_0397 family ICE element conjugal transfer ATPase n=1 Tax=Spiroplasma sp. AdecLV25b TaxID=3027162 RepID=UPI0027E0F6F9|nr:DUF87 domain-containing protein [Spiroplasma sp. AdecLV25b]